MAKLFKHHNTEAIRIKAKKYNGTDPLERRTFSIDPQLTSFDVLQSILAKAFDINEDFAISYHVCDDQNHEIYSAIISDWELDAAFLRAHNESLATADAEAVLCLRIDIKSDKLQQQNEWSVHSTTPRTYIPEIKAQRLPGIIKNQVERTFSLFQKALNLSDEYSYYPPRIPMSDAEFLSFLNPIGQVVESKGMRSVIYSGGIEPSLRKVVWKHLLNVYPNGMSGKERMDYMKRKAAEYNILRNTWQEALKNGPISDDLHYTTSMIRKDVLRTDRQHKFFSGNDDNQNVTSLFNILTTYALNHPKINYCQGMSDLASPLLVVMSDEAHAYVCFCALMLRLGENFMLDGIAMTKKFTHLAEALMYYDPEFYGYLKMNQADDLLFCYRWLLLEMKREFAFDDALHMLEVLWSSLPPAPPEKELNLYESIFRPSAITPPVSPLPRTLRENAYTKVCALRKQYSSLSISDVNTKAKYKNSIQRKIHSFDDVNCKVEKKNEYSKSFDESKIIENGVGKKNGTANLQNHSKSQSRISVSQNIDNLIEMIARNSYTSESNLDVSSSNNSSKASLDVESNDEKVSDVTASNESIQSTESISNPVTYDSTFESNFSLNLAFLANTKKVGQFKDLKERLSKRNLFSPIIDMEGQIGQINHRSHIKSYFYRCKEEISKYNSDNRPFRRYNSEDPEKDTSQSKENGHLNRYTSENYSSQNTSTNPFLNCDESSTNEKSPDKKSPTNIEKYFSIATNLARFQTSPHSEISTNPFLQQKLDKNSDVFVWENPLHQGSPAGSDTDKSTEKMSVADKSKIRNTEEPISSEQPQNPALLNITQTEMTNSCEEVTENVDFKNACLVLPPPHEFGGGNPFLMFLCVTLLLQHRDFVIRKRMDYNEMAMHFDKMVRKHDVIRVLNQARQMYEVYVRQYSRYKKNEGECGDGQSATDV